MRYWFRRTRSSGMRESRSTNFDVGHEYGKKRKSDRIARAIIQFKDFERHATKKSIPLLPLPAEGCRHYG